MPTIQIFAPEQNTVFTLQASESGYTIAAVNFHFKVSSQTYITKIDIKETRYDANPIWVYEREIYNNVGPRPDPLPEEKEMDIQRSYYFEEGMWTVEITALDSSGGRGKASVQFSLVPPTISLGPASILRIHPNEGKPGDEIAIHGYHFVKNDFLKVYLAPCPNSGILLELNNSYDTRKLVLYEAKILSKEYYEKKPVPPRAQRPGSILLPGHDIMRVQIPNIPDTTYVSFHPDIYITKYDSYSLQWMWVIQDPWIRPLRVYPGIDEWKLYPDPYKPPGSQGQTFKLIKP